MEKTKISHKPNGVKVTGKKKISDNKQQTTSETSNLESPSSSYNTLSEIDDSKVTNGTRIRDIEEKSSLSSDEYWNNSKGSLGNQTESRNLSEEHLKPQEQGLEDENVDNETSFQSNQADDIVLHDVEVCDTCGDAGRDDLLAICSKCPDGAEHTYCMRIRLERVPEGDWVCEECKLEENKIRINRQKCSSETGTEKDQYGKRRAEEFESSSSFKKRAVDPIDGSTKDVDCGKVKDSLFGNESSEADRSLATRPRSQSVKGSYFKSKSFSYSNLKAKTKLVDEISLQRQKSTKEGSSHESREMGKSTSINMGRFGPSGSKAKMLSSNSAHDLKSLKNKHERTFERTNSVKSGSSNSGMLTSKGDRLPVSRGENANSEVKYFKGDNKIISGLKSTNRSSNIGAEVPVSLATVNKQLASSPTRVGPTSSSGIINSADQKSNALKDDNPSKLSIPKEPSNLADVIKETTTSSHLGSGLIPSPSGVPPQNNKQTGPTQGSFGNNTAVARNSKEVKNRDNKLKDAIEAALLKKPGIYRKNNESSVSTVNNNDAPAVDCVLHSRNSGLTSAEVANDWHNQSLRNSTQSNGISFKHKQPMMPPAEGKHLTAGLSSLGDVALPSLLKNSAIPDHECIWQGSFEINRSGKTAEFWEGLQGHLSSCASRRVFEAVDSLPHKILLNGVSRVSAWPTQFEKNGVKEDNIAIYFFAKDLESYERSYQVLLDDMIRRDLALIGNVNGVELLIFPSNHLPQKFNRWNMLFFLWGVFRGKKKSPVQVDGPEMKADKISLPESINKDKNVDPETKKFSQEKTTNNNISVANMKESEDAVKAIEINKRPFIDLSEDDDAANQIDTGRGGMKEEEKGEVYGQNDNVFNTSKRKEDNNGEIGSSGFALDLNECLDGEFDGDDR